MCQWGRTKFMLKEFWADSKLGILQALIIIIHNKPYRLVVMTALKSSVRAKEISIDPVTQTTAGGGIWELSETQSLASTTL